MEPLIGSFPPPCNGPSSTKARSLVSALSSHPCLHIGFISQSHHFCLLKYFKSFSLLASSTATISESLLLCFPISPTIEFPHTLARVIVLTHKSDQPFSSLKLYGGFPLCWKENSRPFITPGLGADSVCHLPRWSPPDTPASFQFLMVQQTWSQPSDQNILPPSPPGLASSHSLGLTLKGISERPSPVYVPVAASSALLWFGYLSSSSPCEP